MSEASVALLDANVLIALVVRDHQHHADASRWFARHASVALCPIVEGALVRMLLRLGDGAETAKRLLDGLYASGKVEFWADNVSYAAVDLERVIGRRQVTDAYLVALAASHDARLATFDRGLAALAPGGVELIA